MAKEINLNFALKDLEGVEIANANAGKILANTLVNQAKGDALKFWEWALELNAGKSLQLDSSDFATLKDFVKGVETLPILTKAQMLKAFE